MAEVQDTTIVTLAEMRTFLNLTDDENTDMDAALVAILDSYNDEIEEYLGVTLLNSTYTESYDGDDTDKLFLKHYPIISITSLSIDDTALSARSLTSRVWLI